MITLVINDDHHRQPQFDQESPYQSTFLHYLWDHL